MSAVPVVDETSHAWFPSNASNREWAVLSSAAPQLVATIRRYLVQLTTFLAPRSVEVADQTLRQFTHWLTTATDITIVAGIERAHIEDYRVWLAAQPGQKNRLLAKNTQRHRLRMIRIFLERLIEWDWPDAPGRNPILHGDIPPRSEPIPKFLTDQQAAAFMAAARTHPVARYRLVAQVLARTGLRASELCELTADAVTHIGTDGYWLRCAGRQAPQRPHDPPPPRGRRPVRGVDRHQQRAHSPEPAAARRSPRPDRSSNRAPHHRPHRRNRRHRRHAPSPLEAHPRHPGHQPRHAPRSHRRAARSRSLEMTLVYGKITDRVVADEYASVCEQIDALYATANTPGALPAEIETAAMTRLRQEAHARMLGNGMCTRPVEFDCRMETICETCAYFETGPQFVPVLLRQRDHTRAHRQAARATLYDNLIATAEASAL
jgi:integrase